MKDHDEELAARISQLDKEGKKALLEFLSVDKTEPLQFQSRLDTAATPDPERK